MRGGTPCCKDAGSSIELVSDPKLIEEAIANSGLIELPESSYELMSEEEAWNEFIKE